MLKFNGRLVFPALALLLLPSCSKREAAPPAKVGASAPANQSQATNRAAPVVAEQENPPPAPSSDLSLPVSVKRRTGDLDEIKKSRNLRALVLISPIGFFYDKGLPKGINDEALEELQRFANQKLKLGKLDLKVIFLPTSPGQLEASLTEGLGDIIAYGIVITPEREKRVAFSTPIQSDVSQIVVGGPKLGPVASLQDLSGKEVYINPLTPTMPLAEAQRFVQARPASRPSSLQAADKNLTDDDIVQMVNAGLVAVHRHQQTTGGTLGPGARSLTLHPEHGDRQRRASGVGHAQEQPAIEGLGGRVRPGPRGGNLVRQHAAAPLSCRTRSGSRIQPLRNGDEEV